MIIENLVSLMEQSGGTITNIVYVLSCYHLKLIHHEHSTESDR